MAGMPVGTYTLKATAYDSAGSSATSAPVQVTVSAAPPPTVSITSPASGTTFAAPASIAITADAATPSGSITRVDFYVNNTNMGSAAAAPYSLTVSNLAPGSYSIKAIATDTRGMTATSAVVPVTVSEAAPTVSITSPLTGRMYVAPASISITADATAASGATLTAVEFYNGTTLLGSVSTAPYTYTWSNVPAGSYPLKARAIDSRGVSAESGVAFVSVANPGLEADGGIDGSTVAGDGVLITGSVNAPANSAVDINGVVATMTFDGRFAANDVPLAAGANTLTLRLTTPDGETTTRSITVNRNGDAPFKVSADPAEGVAPLTVRYSVENPSNTPFATIEFDFNGDGTVDYTATTLAAATTSYIYPAGYFRAGVTFKNAQGAVVYATTKAVYVYSPLDRHNQVKGIYTGVVERLRSGNIDQAVLAFTNTIRESYRSAFTQAGASLPALANGLGTIKGSIINSSFAELILSRPLSDGEHAFSVFLIRDDDGIWRIDGF